MNMKDLLKVFFFATISMETKIFSLNKNESNNFKNNLFLGLRRVKGKDFKMREEIKNYKEIIENYYKMQYGKDVVFDFMHIVIEYTYIYLQKPINELRKEGGITVRYEDTR